MVGHVGGSYKIANPLLSPKQGIGGGVNHVLRASYAQAERVSLLYRGVDHEVRLAKPHTPPWNRG